MTWTLPGGLHSVKALNCKQLSWFDSAVQVSIRWGCKEKFKSPCLKLMKLRKKRVNYLQEQIIHSEQAVVSLTGIGIYAFNYHLLLLSVQWYMLVPTLAMNHNEWMINANISKKLNSSSGKIWEFSFLMVCSLENSYMITQIHQPNS